MNEATKAEVLAVVAKWRPRLRLMDWAIAYEWDAKIDEDAAMQCRTWEKYRQLTLRVSTDTKTAHGWMTAEKQVVHELCHALTSSLSAIAETVIEQLKPGQIAYDVAYKILDQADERLTEWIARLMWEAYEGTAWDAGPLTDS